MLNKVEVQNANMLKKVEIQSQVVQAYNVLNQTAVSSEENLIAFDTMGRQDSNESIEFRRKCWCAFVWLETLQITFHALRVVWSMKITPGRH